MTFHETLTHCAKERSLVRQFERLTGHQLLGSEKPLEVMIDKATGWEPSSEALDAFVRFVWECIWVPVCNKLRAENDAATGE